MQRMEYPLLSVPEGTEIAKKKMNHSYKSHSYFTGFPVEQFPIVNTLGDEAWIRA